MKEATNIEYQRSLAWEEQLTEDVLLVIRAEMKRCGIKKVSEDKAEGSEE